MLRRSAETLVRRLLEVPISRASDIGLTRRLDSYSKHNVLAVGIQTVCQSDVGRPRNRYRKSWILKNVMFALDTDSPTPALGRPSEVPLTGVRGVKNVFTHHSSLKP